MFIKRRLKADSRRFAGLFPVVAVVGPRQSGKDDTGQTDLCRLQVFFVGRSRYSGRS